MASDSATVELLRRRRDEVLGRIAGAAARAGRDPGDITLVAVSKTVEPKRIRAAVDAGFDLLGENRVQEAAAKIPEVPGARWHLIGPLQSNKARRAVELFETIESVDSIELARRLDRIVAECGREALPVYLEVNVDRDPHKSGFDSAALGATLPEIVSLPQLRVLGLMTVGHLVADPEAARPTFKSLRALSERLRSDEPRLGPSLSMGMSDDFEVAVEEGATLVRVGRAIFGDRPSAR